MYAVDSSAYIKHEILDTLTIEQNGKNLFIPQFSQTFIPDPFTSPSSKKQHSFIPEDQEPSSLTKVQIHFYEAGDSVNIYQHYDYEPYPIEQQLRWEGRKMK